MKGSLIGLVVGWVAVAGLAAGVGCSSSSSGGGPTGVGCDETIAGQHFCYVYTNLSADQQKAVTDACSGQMGKSVTSCPDGVGTCTFTMSGYNIAETYYCGDKATDKTACTAASGATWADGTASDSCGGDASSSSSGGDASSSSSGSSSGGDASSSSSGGGDSGSSSGGGDAAAD